MSDELPPIIEATRCRKCGKVMAGIRLGCGCGGGHTDVEWGGLIDTGGEPEFVPDPPESDEPEQEGRD